MHGYAKIAGPLNKNLKKGEPNKLVLEEQARHVVDNSKSRLINSPVLALRQQKGPYTVSTDASDTQVRRVLL